MGTVKFMNLDYFMCPVRDPIFPRVRLKNCFCNQQVLLCRNFFFEYALKQDSLLCNSFRWNSLLHKKPYRAGSHYGGKVDVVQSDPPQAENSACRILFYTISPNNRTLKIHKADFV